MQDTLESGVPNLDRVLGGGLPEGDMLLLLGSTGTGKTTLSFQLAFHAARTGRKVLSVSTVSESLPLPAQEPLPAGRLSSGLEGLDVLLGGGRGLWVSLREPPEQLLARARRFGMDLEGALARGALELVHHPTAELLTDEVLTRMDAALVRLRPLRVLLDSVVELQAALLEPQRFHPVLTRLAARLRARGATTLLTLQTRPQAGAELDLSPSPLDLACENRVHLGHRLLSVLHMRESGFDPTPRAYVLDTRGLRLLPPQGHAGDGR